MKISDLVVDAKTGMLSTTKLWSHIGNTAATGAFVAMAYDGSLTEGIWIVYLASMSGHAVLSKVVSMKYGEKNVSQSYDV